MGNKSEKKVMKGKNKIRINKEKNKNEKKEIDTRFIIKDELYNNNKINIDKRGEKLINIEDYIENKDDNKSSECDINIYENIDIFDETYNTCESIHSCRLAVTNIEWSKLDATDLYVFISAFIDRKKIKSVGIYISEFGKKELSNEEMNGPYISNNDELNDEEKKIELKKYYIKRRKYYYGIIELVDEESTNKLYECGNDIEIENTSFFLNLSYIPNDLIINEEPVSFCDKYPNEYIPHEFISKAFQQTNPQFEWDETDSKRLQLTYKKTFTEEDLQDLSIYDQYIAPASSDEEIHSKYNILLQEDKTNTPNVVVDNTLNEINESDTKSSQTSDDSIGDNTIINDPFLTSKSSKKKKYTKKSKKSILSNKKLDSSQIESDDDQHFNYNDILKQSKTNKDDDFKLNFNDNRFCALYTSSKYAIDPTSNKFKSTKNMKEVLIKQTKNKKRF